MTKTIPLFFLFTICAMLVASADLVSRFEKSPGTPVMTLHVPCPVCSAEEVRAMKGPPCPDRGWPFLVRGGDGEETMRHCRVTDPWVDSEEAS